MREKAYSTIDAEGKHKKTAGMADTPSSNDSVTKQKMK